MRSSRQTLRGLTSAQSLPRPPTHPISFLGGSACLALFWPLSLPAYDNLIPYASAQSAYHSNLFALSSSEQVQGADGEPDADGGRSDVVTQFLAGVDAQLRISNQTLRATVEGRHLMFDRYDRLDHDEYLLNGGLDWRLSSILDGMLNYRQERSMASFADRNSTALNLELERVASASLNLAVHPDWRLESGVRQRDLEAPLDNFSGFGVEETSVNAAIKYLGEETLTVGLFGEHTDGEFKGTTDADEFEQQTAALTASYVLSGLSRLGAEIGYTRRQDDSSERGDLSGVTGALSYQREISGKTSVIAQVFRRVGSYTGGASAEKQTGARVGLTWKPTDRIIVTGAYERGESELQETLAASAEPDRQDDLQVAILQLSYRILPWLALRPFGIYEERDSSSALDSFHATTAGVELLARFE